MSKTMDEKQNRQDFMDCVEWLINSDDVSLIKRTTTKKNLTDKEIKSYIKAAEEAAAKIINQSYMEEDACITPQADKFRTACNKGGISMTKQREILTEQSRLFFSLSH